MAVSKECIGKNTWLIKENALPKQVLYSSCSNNFTRIFNQLSHLQLSYCDEATTGFDETKWFKNTASRQSISENKMYQLAENFDDFLRAKYQSNSSPPFHKIARYCNCYFGYFGYPCPYPLKTLIGNFDVSLQTKHNMIPHFSWDITL